MTDILPPPPLPVIAPAAEGGLDADAQAAVDQIAARYRAANGFLMKLVNAAGGQIENQLDLLPDAVKDGIETAARRALEAAYGLAERSHGAGGAAAGSAQDGETARRLHLGLATVSGALGGLGGLPTALAELPVTTTVIFRAVQAVAAGHGFDPRDAAVRAECLAVFGGGTPLERDDGVNTSFLGAKITLTGPTVQRLIAAVAPRFAAVLGQKLAAQAVPVLGAVTGAGVNYAFANYYQELAWVRFALLRLQQRHDPAAVLAAFRAATTPARITRA